VPETGDRRVTEEDGEIFRDAATIHHLDEEQALPFIGDLLQHSPRPV
jgi:hypothetical protein